MRAKTKGLLLGLACCLAPFAVVRAADLRIERVNMGSGLQNATGTENAQPVGDLGVWHAPQYMPGYPTAASIWPRVVEVECADSVCSGYTVTPDLGRGEYLFFRPIRK